MKRKYIFVAAIAFFLSACAQVPKESVELSATVGRDIAETHRAHRELVEILFIRMKRDVNRFVDDVYAPHQIRSAMVRQKELATSTNPDDRRKSLLLAINAAFSDEAPTGLQNKVLKAMGSMVQKIRNDVERMRHELITPLNQQEAEILSAVDRAYQKMHYANSIVTGHLSSVAKVHETQGELLEAFGVERDLRKDVGEKLSGASEEIADLVESAEKVDAKLDKAEENAVKLKDAIGNLAKKLNKDK